MKRSVLILAFGLAGAPAGSLFAQKSAPPASCVPEDKTVIESEVLCFKNGGLDIGYDAQDGVKAACMTDKRVQRVCGPDGRLTRLQAYRLWFDRLKRFEADCLANGGAFAYDDPAFSEPQDDSFCLQAQPEVGSNMFESSLCNYRSACPSVAVTCRYSCDDA